MAAMEKETILKTFILTANQYMCNKNNSNMMIFQHQLEVLHGITSRGSDLRFFKPHSMLPTECVTLIINIMQNPGDTKLSVLTKCVQVLKNLAADKELRKSFHDPFNLSQTLVEIVKHNSTAANSELVLECLHLLQQVTYGHKILLQETYVQDLLEFVLSHITDPVEESTQPCLGILVNLCKDNFSMQTHVKNLEDAKAIRKILLKFISGGGSNFEIIVYSLGIVTSVWLNDEYGQRVFKPSNLNQIFHTIFNILQKGDTCLLRKYTVDLFKELLKDKDIQNSLSQYSRLVPCISILLKLIPCSTAESVVMIFDLLLYFCTIKGVRTLICKCILSTLNLSDKSSLMEALHGEVRCIKEPLVAMVHWAQQSPDTHDLAPLYALDFLSEFYEEMIYSNTRVKYSEHADLVLPMVRASLMSPVETDGENVTPKKHCQKKVHILHLLSVIVGEDDVRKKMMAELDWECLSQMIDFQLNNNHIVFHTSRFSTERENWSDDGVSVVIFCLELMSKMGRFIPSLDGVFCSLLQDSRLVPFLSAGLTSCDRTVVQTSLQLFTTGAHLERFPTLLIGDAIANCNNKKRNSSEVIEALPHVTQTSLPRPSVNGDHDASVQSIIEKMQAGLKVKDINTSEIIDIYEHKLQSLQTKENHLQDLLDAKTLALTQADRLISQYRARRAQYEAEACQMRSLLKESEIRREQLNEVTLQKETLTNELQEQIQENQRLSLVEEEHKQLTVAYTDLTGKYESSQKSILSLKQELKTLTEMHEMLKKHHETLKHQFDGTCDQLTQLQEDYKQQTKILKEKEGKLTELNKSHTKLESKYEELENEKNQLDSCISMFKGIISKTEQAKSVKQDKD